MIAEDAINKLEALAKAQHPGDISIDRIWSPRRLPWSCSIGYGEGGEGVGNTMLEAIEDALNDLYEQHRPEPGSCYAQQPVTGIACGLERDHDGDHAWEGFRPCSE